MASSAAVASAVTGDPNAGPGVTNAPTNPGRRPLGSTTKSAPTGVSGPSSAAVANAVTQGLETPQIGGKPNAKMPPPQKMQKQPKLSPTMMGPAPIPHPGVSPPYPDARSPSPTLMPNGVPVLPMPPGFPLAGAIPRVPMTFAPSVHGMTSLLGK